MGPHLPGLLQSVVMLGVARLRQLVFGNLDLDACAAGEHVVVGGVDTEGLRTVRMREDPHLVVGSSVDVGDLRRGRGTSSKGTGHFASR